MESDAVSQIHVESSSEDSGDSDSDDEETDDSLSDVEPAYYDDNSLDKLHYGVHRINAPIQSVPYSERTYFEWCELHTYTLSDILQDDNANADNSDYIIYKLS